MTPPDVLMQHTKGPKKMMIKLETGSYENSRNVLRMSPLPKGRYERARTALTLMAGGEPSVALGEVDEIAATINAHVIPAGRGHSVIKNRCSKLDIRCDWLEFEPVIAWVFTDGTVVPLTLKHGAGKHYEPILHPDGKVVDIYGTHDNLAAWQTYHAREALRCAAE